jgi:hypothetical protein
MLRALLEELGVVPKRKVGAQYQKLHLDFDAVDGDVEEGVGEGEGEVEGEGGSRS